MLTLLKSRNVGESPTPIFRCRPPRERSSRSPAGGCRCGPSRPAPTRSTARRGAVSPSTCGWPCRTATPSSEHVPRPAEAAVRAVGHDGVSEPAARPAQARRPAGRRHPARTLGRSPAQASVPCWERRAGDLGVLGHHPVEIAPAHSVAVGREDRVLRPRQFQRPALGGAANPRTGTSSAPRRAPCPGAASRPSASARHHRSSPARTSCARRRPRRARGGPASRPQTPPAGRRR